MKIEHRKVRSSTDYYVYEGWEVIGWAVATLSLGNASGEQSPITAKPGLERWLNVKVAP